MARNLAVLHKKYAVDPQRAVGTVLWFCRRPVLRIGNEEAPAARTWRWRQWKISSCARRHRRWRFFGPTIFASAEVGVLTIIFLSLCLVLPLLCNLFICASRVMDLGRTCGRLWRSGTPCATWPAALVGLLTGPREKIMRLSCFFWATGCVQTDSVSAQIRRNRRLESPLVVLPRIHHFAAGAR